MPQDVSVQQDERFAGRAGRRCDHRWRSCMGPPAPCTGRLTGIAPSLGSRDDHAVARPGGHGRAGRPLAAGAAPAVPLRAFCRCDGIVWILRRPTITPQPPADPAILPVQPLPPPPPLERPSRRCHFAAVRGAPQGAGAHPGAADGVLHVEQRAAAVGAHAGGVGAAGRRRRRRPAAASGGQHSVASPWSSE